MKYLKIAALISLINAIFFGSFLFILNKQNSQPKPIEKTANINNQEEEVEISEIYEEEQVTGENGVEAIKAPDPVKPNSMASTPAVSNRCIVTVEGQKYDVTDFRLLHSGGDIFVCGTDMTNTFFGQHNQEILDGAKMQGMKVQ